MLLAAILTLAVLGGWVAPVLAEPPVPDTYYTSCGPLTVTPIGHGSLLFNFVRRTIYVDPYAKVGDYKTLPQADLILLTHEHGDHLDPVALDTIAGPDTPIIETRACQEKLGRGTVLENGQSTEALGIGITAVPAYNLKHKRESGEPFHPKGRGNGYLLNFCNFTVYVAGDTEDIPEMQGLPPVDVAFLPMNLPYTMTPEMAAHAARMVRPKVLYPYHYGDTDPQKLVQLLAKDGIDVQVRELR